MQRQGSSNDRLWRPATPLARAAVVFAGSMVYLAMLGGFLLQDEPPHIAVVLTTTLLIGGFTFSIARDGLPRR